MNTPRLLINGMSVTQVSEKYGIPVAAIYNRLRRNWDDDRIINTPATKHKKFIAGMTVEEVMELTGLAKGAVESRHRRGWSDDEILNTPSGEPRSVSTTKPIDSWNQIVQTLPPEVRLFCGVVA